MAKKFNKRESSFIYWRARGYTLKESVIKAGYKAQTDGQATAYGSRLEAKGNISEAVDKEKVNIFDKTCITEELILENLKNLALNAKNESDRIRAWELLGKHKAMFTDRIESHNINEEKRAELDGYYTRLVGSKEVSLSNKG